MKPTEIPIHTILANLAVNKTLKDSVEGSVFLEKTAAIGNPCDFVLEYRRLLPDCKNREAWMKAAGRWKEFWELMRRGVELVATKKPQTHTAWHLSFQNVTPDDEERPARLSALAAKAESIFKYYSPVRLMGDLPDTPETRMNILARSFCANLRKDPNLLLHADNMELKTLKISAEEFSNQIEQTL